MKKRPLTVHLKKLIGTFNKWINWNLKANQNMNEWLSETSKTCETSETRETSKRARYQVTQENNIAFRKKQVWKIKNRKFNQQ